MTDIAIVGTAGRAEDADRLSWDVYRLMLRAVREKLAQVPWPHHLRSGGAAWADHLAVLLYLADQADSLSLYLPCPLSRANYGFLATTDEGRTLNRYHAQFSAKMPQQHSGELRSHVQIAQAMEKGALVEVVPGFKPRNLRVGRCDVMIALTYGEGAEPKDGGTRHCWDHSSATTKIHIPIGALGAALQRSRP